MAIPTRKGAIRAAAAAAPAATAGVDVVSERGVTVSGASGSDTAVGGVAGEIARGRRSEEMTGTEGVSVTGNENEAENGRGETRERTGLRKRAGVQSARSKERMKGLVRERRK